jgi:2-hydroxy-3-keto-5-methylthiopentenyl-1-phosphate phosphatase
MAEKTGYHAAKWLCNYCQENKIKFPEYYVHSFNQIGKENIIGYIENYRQIAEEIIT